MIEYRLKKSKIYQINDYIFLVGNNLIICYLENKIIWQKHIFDEIQINDRYIATENKDNTVSIYTLDSGHEYKIIDVLENFLLVGKYLIITENYKKFYRIDIETNHKISFELNIRSNLNFNNSWDNNILLTSDNLLVIYDVENLKLISVDKFKLLPNISVDRGYLIICNYKQIKLIKNDQTKIINIPDDYHEFINHQLNSEYDIIQSITVCDKFLAINYGFYIQIINLENNSHKNVDLKKIIYDIKLVSDNRLLISLL